MGRRNLRRDEFPSAFITLVITLINQVIIYYNMYIKTIGYDIINDLGTMKVGCDRPNMTRNCSGTSLVMQYYCHELIQPIKLFVVVSYCNDIKV